MLTREQILNADDLKRETIHIDEWGGDVIVREMTAYERIDLMNWANKMRETDEAKYLTYAAAKFAVVSVIDENGEKMFTDDDLDALAHKNTNAVSKIADVAQRLSGMREEDNEEMIKNSKKGRGERSVSD